MKKACILSVLLMIVSCSGLFAEGIIGFWKSINETTHKPECILAIYEHQGIYYGRMIGTFNAEGKMEDTIYSPKDRAPGVKGHPFYSGLDFIWGLHNKGSRYNGKIMDPRKGDIYKAELWIKDGNLIVRGKFLMFGRNTVWFPALEGDFPQGFKKPDITQFVPAVPEPD